MSEPRNPGWAGETGEFADLEEADVRGVDYVGRQPPEGWAHGGVTAYPYQLAARDADAPLFEGPYAERLEKILARYPEKRAALLPVLNLAQEIRGHLSAETMDRVAEVLDEAPAAVRGVATFYTMYNMRPVGRYLIQVCTNVACNLCGADDVLQAFLDGTGTELGEIGEDGLFSVMEVECLGACGFPTAVQINSRYFENVEAGAVPDILARLRDSGIDPVSSAGSGAGARKAGGAASAAGEAGADVGAGSTGAGGASGAAEDAGSGEAAPGTEEGER